MSPPGAGSTVTTRQLPRAERREQLLGAAARAFARGGFDGTSMDDVAGEAGVTRLIVYRHFDSKEDLYREVLDRVSGVLADEFVTGFRQPNPRGTSARAMLRAARTVPDGFVLLWRHAAHEPAFSGYAAELRDKAVAAAEGLIGDTIGDPTLRRWASGTIVGYLVEATLRWLEVGDDSRDDEFVERTTAGLVALYESWLT